jgi:hypothetical protein
MPAYRRNPDQVSDRIKRPPSFTIILQHYFRGVAVLEYYHPATSPAFFTFHGVFSWQVGVIKNNSILILKKSPEQFII